MTSTKFILLMAVLAGAFYYWWASNPNNATGNSATSAIGSSISRAETKARNMR